MATATSYWADNYVEKQRDADKAIGMIKSGRRIFVGSSCGEPQHLLRGLLEHSKRFSDVEVVRLMSMESAPLTLSADNSRGDRFNIRSFYMGSAQNEELAKNIRFMTPVNLSYIPRMFKNRMFPLDAALIQVTPPDDFGWMSLGVSVDITLAAAQAAEIVIAQVNDRMPWTLGTGFIHVNDVDAIVEHNEDLLTIGRLPETETANTIGRYIARLIDDGATLQIGLGTTPSATLLALSDKNDLGIHTQYLTDDIMHLVSMGVITNRHKGFNDGKLVASDAIGSRDLYDYLHYNPSIDFHPSDYVNDPRIISRHNRMTALNVAKVMDLTGQVAVDALPFNYFSGVSGVFDFTHGAALAEGGKSILMLTSTNRSGEVSRIVPRLNETAVVIPRADVNYVVTEYGAVNLLGKNYQERAMAIISIAHPDFRDELFQKAKQMGLLPPERKYKPTLSGVYPIKLEETRMINGQEVTIRPAKPVDERRIQEHFYGLEDSDVFTRFFHAKKKFVRDEMEGMSQIDYIKHLTIVAVVGEFGFGRVIGVGEYALEESTNMAEVAFSISKDWQGKGLGTILINKLAEAARENGIAGFTAYVLPENHRMIGLFKRLPYKVKTVFDTDIILSCKFDEMRDS